jgi:hypothetical protein
MRLTKTLFFALLFSVFFTSGLKATGNLANVEAMFIYNFLRHVSWPENSGGDVFIIGVYGNSDIYNQLIQYTANRKVGSKNIEIRKITAPADASLCQLVFIPASHTSSISSIKSQLGNRSCLIVGEKEGANAQGSTIEFVVKDNTLKFRINEERARQQNLLFSRALIDMSIQ